MMPPLPDKKTRWKEYLFICVKLVWQKLSKYYAEVTPTMGILGISTHILHCIWKLRSGSKWDKGMDINPEDQISDRTQHD